jgi:hypothetical protein
MVPAITGHRTDYFHEPGVRNVEKSEEKLWGGNARDI